MLGLFAGAVLLFVFFVYLSRRRRFSLFRELGIPGPTPSLISGNMSEINKMGPVPLFEKWIRKYGDIVGFYSGATPILLVKNLDLIQRIQITDFSNFRDRGALSVENRTNQLTKNSLVNSSGDQWKKVRSVVISAFTPRKMQKLQSLMAEVCNEFMEDMKITEEKKKSFEISQVLQKLCLTMILRTACGIKPSPNGVEMNEITKELHNFASSLSGGWMSHLFNCFPEFTWLWRCVMWFRGVFTKFPHDLVLEIMMPVINERRRNPEEGHKDMLQLLLDAEVGKSADDKNRQPGVKHDEDGRNNKNRRLLNETEIQANVLAALVDGFETLPTAMTFTLYLLAKHQDEQDRLREEIKRALNGDEELSAENILKLEYLNQVISEALRLYAPLAGFVSRTCVQDYDFNGLKIPSGMVVLVAASSLHYDTKLWVEPLKFDPGRFSNSNKGRFNPMSYQAFGNGPRACIAMRYGQVALKLTLCKILTKYRLLLDDRHLKEERLTLTNSLIFSAPRDGVWLKLQEI